MSRWTRWGGREGRGHLGTGEGLVSYTHQPVSSSEPARGVGADADGVFTRVMGGEGEPPLGSIVPGEHRLAKGVLDL